MQDINVNLSTRPETQVQVTDAQCACNDIWSSWQSVMLQRCGTMTFLVTCGLNLAHTAHVVWIYKAPILWLFMFGWSLWWHPDPDADDCTHVEMQFHQHHSIPMPVSLAMALIAVILGTFLNAACTLYIFLVLWIGWTLTWMHHSIWHLFEFLTASEGMDVIHWGLVEREGTMWVVFLVPLDLMHNAVHSCHGCCSCHHRLANSPPSKNQGTHHAQLLPSSTRFAKAWLRKWKLDLSSATGSKEDWNWTYHQQQAARKIGTQVHMMCFEAESSSNPAALWMALQSPTKFRNSMLKESTFCIIWDSGSSLLVSPCKSDFVGPYTKLPITLKLIGLTKGLDIKGQGHIMWAVQDTYGQLQAIKVLAYNVPGCKVHLLSMTSLNQSYPPGHITIDKAKLVLGGIPGQPTCGSVIAQVDEMNNLQTLQAYAFGNMHIPVEALQTTITAVDAENHNLTEPEKELLHWHYHLGHLGYQKIQALMRSGILSHSHARCSLHTATSKICAPPKQVCCKPVWKADSSSISRKDV